MSVFDSRQKGPTLVGGKGCRFLIPRKLIPTKLASVVESEIVLEVWGIEGELVPGNVLVKRTWKTGRSGSGHCLVLSFTRAYLVGHRLDSVMFS